MDNLAKDIVKHLEAYTREVQEEIVNITNDITKEAVKELKSKTPFERTGEYKKGWARKKQGDSYVIYNKNKPQLTHLLEHGHVNRDGSRTPGKAHIRPVEEAIVIEYQKRIEKAIKS